MNNAEIIKLLMPLPLGGDYEGLIAAQGALLDAVSTDIDDFLNEVVPTTATKNISDWERVYKIVPTANATLASRRVEVVRKKVTGGGLSRQYFIALAAVLGQTISIDEYVPVVCGVAVCGDTLGVPRIRWMWTVRGLGQGSVFSRCGTLHCGEALSYPATSIEALFNKLKPSHTQINYVYE